MDYFRGTDATSEVVRKRLWKRLFWGVCFILLATIAYYLYFSFIFHQAIYEIFGR
ncbi:MAG: hypothetical protein AAFO03_27600 [Bacteroidota bacterium]